MPVTSLEATSDGRTFLRPTSSGRRRSAPRTSSPASTAPKSTTSTRRARKGRTVAYRFTSSARQASSSPSSGAGASSSSSSKAPATSSRVTTASIIDQTSARDSSPGELSASNSTRTAAASLAEAAAKRVERGAARGRTPARPQPAAWWPSRCRTGPRRRRALLAPASWRCHQHGAAAGLAQVPQGRGLRPEAITRQGDHLVRRHGGDVHGAGADRFDLRQARQGNAPALAPRGAWGRPAGAPGPKKREPSSTSNRCHERWRRAWSVPSTRARQSRSAASALTVVTRRVSLVTPGNQDLPLTQPRHRMAEQRPGPRLKPRPARPGSRAATSHRPRKVRGSRTPGRSSGVLAGRHRPSGVRCQTARVLDAGLGRDVLDNVAGYFSRVGQERPRGSARVPSATAKPRRWVLGRRVLTSFKSPSSNRK